MKKPKKQERKMRKEKIGDKGGNRCGCRERERERVNLKKAGKTAQKSCAYLRYKDRLCRIVCLFFVPDSS